MVLASFESLFKGFSSDTEMTQSVRIRIFVELFQYGALEGAELKDWIFYFCILNIDTFVGMKIRFVWQPFSM